MVIAALIGGVVAALVALYLIRPYYQRVLLSAARFFDDSSESNESRIKLHFRILILSRSFWLQLATLLALLAAVLLINFVYTTKTGESSGPWNLLADFVNMKETEKGIGLWLVLDTSASMSTLQDSKDRMQAARQEIDRLVKYLKTQQKDHVQCIKFSTFDLEMNTVPTIHNLDQIQSAVADITPRALGTDLSLIQNLLSQSTDMDKVGCSITHVVVISDSPPTEALVANSDAVRLIWRDLAKPVSNIGLTRITGGGHSLGQDAEVELEVTAYGDQSHTTELTVTDPTGKAILAEPLTWQQAGAKRISFTPEALGVYSIHLSKGGAYSYDDNAAIEVDIPKDIRVDWQYPDQTWLRLLKWKNDANQPDLRVMADVPPSVDGVPTLIVGDGYNKKPDDAQIVFFDESSTLLADLNLDIAESLNIKGISVDAGTLFRPVLLGSDESMWLAEMSAPHAFYIPGLPTATGDENKDAFTTTVFFNAVQSLLDKRKAKAFYELTSPAHPVPEGTRLALHPGEGNTSQKSHSLGDVTDIKPEAALADGIPLWPLFVALAAGLLLIERSLAMWGGSKWN